jgi:hypothetical protein
LVFKEDLVDHIYPADDGGRAVIVNVSARKFVTYCNVLARMAFGSVAATAALQAHVIQTQYMQTSESSIANSDT